MYELDAGLDAEVEPGTNLLVEGPAMSGKYALSMDVLAAGTADGEGAVVVTTKDGAEHVLDDYRDRVDVDGRPVAVIDTVTQQQGMGEVTETESIKYTSSPVDMTGIGIKFSEVMESFYADRGVERNRVLLHSLSTLLMYSELQTVFRFLHVFTGRVQSADALGLYTIDPEAHDDRELNTVKQLFDGIVTTSEGGPPSLRLADS